MKNFLLPHREKNDGESEGRYIPIFSGGGGVGANSNEKEWFFVLSIVPQCVVQHQSQLHLVSTLPPSPSIFRNLRIFDLLEKYRNCLIHI
jgi:hypothetical protein